MVINPEKLIKEMKYVEEHGADLTRLKISNRAHVIFPYHIEWDHLQEERKGIERQIGTTKKGIGPAYADKINRIGIRMADLIDEITFREKLRQAIDEKILEFGPDTKHESLDFDKIYETYRPYGEQLAPYVTDTSLILDKAIQANERILFEGAQGVMLDIDHGTYPYVTSSSTSAAGVATGSGVGPNAIHHVLGVSKAYTTRVGDGPFPTELSGEIGDRIREVGKEYGTTTGRPRRVGWFDAVILNHARRTNGMTSISLNLLDVLTGLDELKICTKYKLDGEEIEYLPANLRELSRVKPVYETLPGWKEDITGVSSFSELPIEAQEYIERIEALTGVDVAIFSVGPDRSQTIVRKELN